MSLAEAVRSAIDALDAADTDTAAVELALAYATRIDAGHCSECDADTSLDTLGPKLLAALEALLLTPRARAVTRKGDATDDRLSNPLDELRARRAARVDDTKAVDTAAP